ncbi:class I SAM-dependent methyltransferase [bacterium]|nr:class I SAM-dependent methyltransferase [bacterium]
MDYYDQEAEATGWLGPEVAFGMAYKYIQPGQSILDLGIGTGLAARLFHQAGLGVYGMDNSKAMLDICREKGLTDNLSLHDINFAPYPYNDASIDHCVCVGVLNFFNDLSGIFGEVARIIRDNGIFVFVVGRREIGDEAKVVVGSEHTGSDLKVTMYRHNFKQISDWLNDNSFKLIQNLEFTVYMDREKQHAFEAMAYLTLREFR